MVLEIKRSFLLQSTFAAKFIDGDVLRLKKVEITEFYTEILPQNETLFCATNNEYLKITKTGFLPQIRQTNITQSEFEAQIPNAISFILKRDRYHFKLDNRSCTIDFYRENFGDIVIFEIEFLNVSDANEFKMPQFLQNLLPLEITENAKFSSKNLAIFGKPLKFDYKNCIKKLEILGQIKLNFHAQINSYDAFRLLLFGLYGQISKNSIGYLKNKDSATLSLLSENFEITIFLLKFFPDVIDERILAKFEFGFASLGEEIRHLITQVSAFNIADEFEFKLKNRDLLIKNLQIAKDNLILNLSSQNFREMMKSWEFVLNDEVEFYAAKDATKLFKQNLAYNLRKFALTILVLLKSKNISKYSQNQYLNLLFLLEYFDDLLMLKSVQKLAKRLEKFTKITAIILQNKEILEIKFCENSSEFYKNLALNIGKNRKKALQKQPKIIKNLHKLSKNLKALY